MEQFLIVVLLVMWVAMVAVAYRLIVMLTHAVLNITTMLSIVVAY